MTQEKRIEMIKEKIHELQQPLMDENGHFPTNYKEGYFDGLADLETFIDNL